MQFSDADIAADTTVTVGGAVAPGGVTVNNTTYNYTLSGSGAITGSTGLTKAGAGTLTLATANSFSGPVVINGGTLKVGSATALGSTVAGATINAGGVLDTNAQALGAKAITLAGGKMLNSGAQQSTAPRSQRRHALLPDHLRHPVRPGDLAGRQHDEYRSDRHSQRQPW